MLVKRYFTYGANNLEAWGNTVLDVILIAAAVIALGIALFVPNIWVKAVAVAYILLP